jgi:hypothetical protein
VTRGTDATAIFGYASHESCPVQELLTVSPTATTHFEAWGRGLYSVAAEDGRRDLCGFGLIFAVADISHQWLAWYAFADKNSAFAAALSQDLKVVGEGAQRSSHFATQIPVTAEGLCGPVQACRRTRDYSGRVTGTPTYLEWRKYLSGGDEINLSLFILGDQSERGGTSTIVARVNLYLRRTADIPAYQEPSLGFIRFLFSEPFDDPARHVDVQSRLRALCTEQ